MCTFAPAITNQSGCSAVRLAHLLWEQGVPGSNPGIPTKREKRKFLSLFCLWHVGYLWLHNKGVLHNVRHTFIAYTFRGYIRLHFDDILDAHLLNLKNQLVVIVRYNKQLIALL